MNLIQLTNADIGKDKRLICIEKSLSYLDELCSRFDVLDKIAVILDDNPRSQGVLYYRNREIPVYALDYLRQADLSDAVLLITGDYYREHFDRIAEMLDGTDHGLGENIYFFANQETEYALSYREKYADAPLENCIVFRSGPHADAYVEGMDFADNARALFEYALSIGLNERYALVWLVKSPDEFEAYAKYRNVSFLPFDGSVSDDSRIRDRYYRALCLAKYFFFTDAYGFVRNCRQDQVRVQLWHGCGYKKRLSAVSCEKRYEYMTVTSGLYARLHAKAFGLRDGQMLVTGCAKTDWLFRPPQGILEMLHIPPADRYIFWMPTYRFSERRLHKPTDGTLDEETGLPLIAGMAELEHIHEKLIQTNTVLVIKLHPFQDREAVHVGDFSNIIILENALLREQGLQINQVLGKADALISDYSSTAVDYLLLDRPMAFLVEDADRYADARGFIFENLPDWLPGRQIWEIGGFLSFIKEVADGIDTMKDKRAELLKKMHTYKDGNSCRRILETLGIEQGYES